MCTGVHRSSGGDGEIAVVDLPPPYDEVCDQSASVTDTDSCHGNSATVRDPNLPSYRDYVRSLHVVVVVDVTEDRSTLHLSPHLLPSSSVPAAAVSPLSSQ